MVETIRQLLEDNRAQQETMIVAFVDFLKNWQPEVKTVSIVNSSVENGNLPLSTVEIAPKLAAKQSPKAEMVIDWLKSNPEKIGMSNRKIAELLGVTHPTVAEAKKTLTAGNTNDSQNA